MLVLIAVAIVALAPAVARAESCDWEYGGVVEPTPEPCLSVPEPVSPEGDSASSAGFAVRDVAELGLGLLVFLAGVRTVQAWGRRS